MESSGIVPSLVTLTHPVQVPQNRVLEPKGQLHITNILYRKKGRLGGTFFATLPGVPTHSGK